MRHWPADPDSIDQDAHSDPPEPVSDPREGLSDFMRLQLRIDDLKAISRVIAETRLMPNPFWEDK